jgi:predicted DNA-binding transcriptional regulator AlpA
MEWTVRIEMTADRPVDEDTIWSLDGDERGTALAVEPGGRDLSATLTVEAPTVPIAAEAAIAHVTAAVAGVVHRVQIDTAEAYHRWLTEPPFPELVGTAEVAEMLGVSRQRVNALTAHPDFPRPVAELAAGKVWRKGDLSRFAEEWARRPGRPRKTVRATA